MRTQIVNNEEDSNDNCVLDLSVKKRSPILSSPPPSSSSSSSTSPKSLLTNGKHLLDLNSTFSPAKVHQTNKRPLRFQCKHCDYKAPSTSLMQNHIYRHTDLTPYACAYCGHKSTTKSTIMVHIELCHPNMEVKIVENRVREQDFYRDLNCSEVTNLSNTNDEPQTKKQRRSNQYDSESAPINGVAISLKTIVDDRNELSPASDEICEGDNPSSFLLPTSDLIEEDNEQPIESSPFKSSSSFKLKTSQNIETPSDLNRKESDSDDDSEYLLVYNRPKQYYGSLYEPDKQYACRLCSYTTNHRPSMEDHVFVHTNEKPYKCGYCGEEIYTRYAATYHIKYKHPGMARNFIQNKADVTQYYVNRAKKEEEKNQFKIVDTRRVKVPTRNGKSTNSRPPKQENCSNERPTKCESSPVKPSPPPVQTLKPQATNISQIPATPDYRFLLACSYYLATQNAWLSPMLRQQPIPNDPEAAGKFLQIMQNAMNPQISNNNQNENDSGTKNPLDNIKEETDES